MNNSIKRYIFILILITSFIKPILSQEIVITIPEEFSKIELPLPPFPYQAINSLPQYNYEDIILNDISTRIMGNELFEYTYYYDFLKKDIHVKSLITQTFGIDTDFNNTNIGYRFKLTNNFYSIESYLSLSSDMDLDLQLEYSEYRLPFYIILTGMLEDENITLSVGNKNYNKEWFIQPTYSSSQNNIELGYKNLNFFNILLWGYLNQDIENKLILALGSQDFRFGIGEINLEVYPYLEILLKYDYINLELESSIIDESLNYLFSVNFNKFFNNKLAVGLDISDNYSEIKPYIYISENFLIGNREYKYSEDEFNFKFSFIKDGFTSIISLDLYEFNTYDISLELNFKNFNINSNYIYSRESNETEVCLSISYKVGKL